MIFRLIAAALLVGGGLATAIAQEPAISPAPPAASEGGLTATTPPDSLDSTGAVAPIAPATATPVADWAGAPVISADGVEVGTVSTVEVGPAGEPIAVMAEVGGFLGFGTETVRLPVSAANFDGNEVRIGMVETDVQSLSDGARDGIGINPE